MHYHCQQAQTFSSHPLWPFIPCTATMPKKLMKAVKKKQKPCPWPVPKRGKARSNMKAPMKSKQNKKVPYVRHHDKIQPVDRRQSRWGLSVVTLAHMKGRALVRRLRQDGILQKWEHQECPHCAQGALSELYFDRYKKVWAHRCSKRGCQARVQPHDFHPIFFAALDPATLLLECKQLFCSVLWQMSPSLLYQLSWIFTESQWKRSILT